MFRNVLIFVLVAIGAILLLRMLRRPKRLFEIRVGDRQVTILGPVPNRAQQDVREFIESLRLPIGSRISAVDTGSDFRLVFSRSIRADDQDRVEHFIRQ